MVSGVTAPPKYKSNKRFFGSSSSQHSTGTTTATTTTPPASPGRQHHQNSSNSQYSSKKYSDNGMRPWPPTYKSDSSTSRPSSMENFRSLSSSTAKFYHNNTTNGNQQQQHSASNNNYKNSIYEAKKFNFHSTSTTTHQQQQHNSGNGNSPTSGLNENYGQNNKDYYLMPPPYENSKMAGQTGSIFYDQDSNMMLKARDREKNRFRKLR